MGFPILPFFILFLVLLSVRFHSLKDKQKQQEETFWDKERIARTTPAKDISNLRYINIPMEKFPLNFIDDEKVIEIENELQELSTHKLLNLTGMTNTDLKITYGAPNFEIMSQIGDDFDKMCILLNSYAQYLIAYEMLDEAITVLEFAIGVGTDISESYVLLAACYEEKGMDNKLELLKTQITESKLLLKNSIISKIDASSTIRSDEQAVDMKL